MSIPQSRSSASTARMRWATCVSVCLCVCECSGCGAVAFRILPSAPRCGEKISGSSFQIFSRAIFFLLHTNSPVLKTPHTRATPHNKVRAPCMHWQRTHPHTLSHASLFPLPAVASGKLSKHTHRFVFCHQHHHRHYHRAVAAGLGLRLHTKKIWASCGGYSAAGPCCCSAVGLWPHCSCCETAAARAREARQN